MDLYLTLEQDLIAHTGEQQTGKAIGEHGSSSAQSVLLASTYPGVLAHSSSCLARTCKWNMMEEDG